MLQGILISLTGFLVVFVMLFILYMAIKLLEVFSNKVETEVSTSENVSGLKIEDDSEEIAAVMAAVSTLLEGKRFEINRIYLKDEHRTLWSKERWQNIYLGRGQK